MNINGDIVSTPGGASYAVYSSGQSSGETASASAGSASSGDTLEISDEGRAASLGTFKDRFRFDIDNGLMNPRQKFQAYTVEAGSVAAATYATRGQTEGLMMGGGMAGTYGAIFSLGYQSTSPTGASNGVAYRQAINAFQRIADRNLPLLSMFG